MPKRKDKGNWSGEGKGVSHARGNKLKQDPEAVIRRYRLALQRLERALREAKA